MKSLFAFLLLTFSFSYAHAQLFHGPLSSALGGSGRAALDASESAFLNPALVPLVKGNEFDGYFGSGELDPGSDRDTWGFGATDNTPDVMCAGSLHYLHLRTTGLTPTPANGDLWHVALGRLTLGNMAIGASGYRLSYSLPGRADAIQWNYSLGWLWAFADDMGVAYVLNNIAKPGGMVPVGLQERTQQGAGFYAGLFEIARFRFDITRNEVDNVGKKMVYMSGFESLFGTWAVLRLGYKLDDQMGQRYVTAGLGFNGPRLRFDYAIEKNLVGTTGALQSVDFRLPF